MNLRRTLLLLLLLVLAGCRSQRGSGDPAPTSASIDALATSKPLTQNAPPPPYNEAITQFELIDNGLTDLPGWRYTVQLEFNGVFARTPREVSAAARADVQFNQVASARRVLFSTVGELFGQAEDAGYEGVRLGPDAFLVRDNTCLSNAQTDAATAADLRAGELVGGVRRAMPAGRQAVINSETVYAYTFAPDDLNLPPVRVLDGGSITIDSSELWIAPARGAVVRYYANLSVENVILLNQQLPVTGSVLLRYDLYDVGSAVNISVPFGC